MANLKATLITIGDELLIGQTVDTNSVWIAQRLGPLGIDVQRRLTVGDDADQIRVALDESIRRTDLVLMTGGLGPTDDDITKEVLVEYFDSPLVRHAQTEKQIEGQFRSRGLPMLERNRRQADLPKMATILPNPVGSAPGMLFRREKTWVISLPGVPDEMKEIMTGSVLPMLESNFISDAIEHQSIVTAGMGESFLAETIEDLESRLPPHIRLAYLPSPGMVRLRISGRGKEREALKQEMDQYKGLLIDRIAEWVVSEEDLNLEEILSRDLKRLGKEIGLAESCTGGNIAHLLTQVPGSGQCFRGGIVCYQNDIKTDCLGVDPAAIETKGPVSEWVAREMALGARRVLKADLGFGITGLLDPNTPQGEIPGGRVWMAFADGKKVFSKAYQLTYDRSRNKEVAVQLSLLFIWKNLMGK